MSKKKSRKRVIKTIAPKVAVIFDCPFCDHKKTVDVKM
jgi:transcription elongation factor Elf1